MHTKFYYVDFVLFFVIITSKIRIEHITRPGGYSMKKNEIIKELVNVYRYSLPAALAIYNYISDNGRLMVVRTDLDNFLENEYYF